MARFTTPNNPLAGHIDIDAIVRQTYDEMRQANRLTSPEAPDLTYAETSIGVCDESAHFMTRSLATALAAANVGLQAYLECHDISDDIDHWYSVVAEPEGDPWDDIVVDATYSQFFTHEDRLRLPYAFVGNRTEVVSMMGDRESCDFYLPETFDPEATQRFASSYNLPFRDPRAT